MPPRWLKKELLGILLESQQVIADRCEINLKNTNGNTWGCD